MSKKYYKIVKLSSKSKYLYTSCRIHDTGIACTYIKNEWTHPHIVGSKLMVFNNLSNAKTFIIDTCGSKDIIFECEVIKPSRKWGGFSKNTYHVMSETFRNAMKLRYKKKKHSHLLVKTCDSPPRGTIFCDAVKLTNKVG